MQQHDYLNAVLEMTEEVIGRPAPMSDEEIRELKADIYNAIVRLNDLQKTYRQQTGRDYHPFV